MCEKNLVNCFTKIHQCTGKKKLKVKGIITWRRVNKNERTQIARYFLNRNCNYLLDQCEILNGQQREFTGLYRSLIHHNMIPHIQVTFDNDLEGHLFVWQISMNWPGTIDARLLLLIMESTFRIYYTGEIEKGIVVINKEGGDWVQHIRRSQEAHCARCHRDGYKKDWWAPWNLTSSIYLHSLVTTIFLQSDSVHTLGFSGAGRDEARCSRGWIGYNWHGYCNWK